MMRRTKNKRNQKRGYGLIRPASYTNFENISRTFLDPHKYITLRYSEVANFTLATVTGTQALFRLNSIFDPNAAVGGHQPYGYDQMAALYNRYRVLACRWKITFGTQASTYKIVILPINGALASAITTSLTFETACETPRARLYTQGGGGAPTVVANGHIKLNDLNGVTIPEYLADDRFEAQIGANPAEVMNLIIGIYNPTTGTITIDYTVELIYKVDLHDPLAVAGS
jgi:hypothetical protein